MSGICVLVACEPVAYREAIAGAFRELRPGIEVVEVESENLDQEARRLKPDLVVCSRITSPVRDHVPNWVELYPGSQRWSVVCKCGERSTVEEMQLSDLLSIVDEVA